MIQNFLKTLLDKLTSPQWREFILWAAVVLLAIMWFRSCSNERALKAEAGRNTAINEQNQRALTDSIHHEKNKNGEMEAVKSALVVKLGDLSKLNSDLYAESKKEKGIIQALIKGTAVVNAGGFSVSDSLIKYPDGKTFGLAFNKTQADSGVTSFIRGESKFKLINNVLNGDSTDILDNRIKIKFVMGFTEDDKNYRVFARSLSPKVEFDQMSGVMFIQKPGAIQCPDAPKKKRFGIGPQVGIGIGPNLKPSPFIGIGIIYNIINF